MEAFEHLLKSYDTADLLDDIASADPPAYLRRCFAEACSAPQLSWPRVQQLAVCSMVVDAVVNGREYAQFEHELIADWRLHYATAFGRLRDPACRALRRARSTGAPAADGSIAADGAAASMADAPSAGDAASVADAAAAPAPHLLPVADAAPAADAAAELRELEQRLEHV